MDCISMGKERQFNGLNVKEVNTCIIIAKLNYY